MESQGQLDLLIELHDLEKALKTKKGRERKKVENRIDGICSQIDAWVLKHYRRHEAPFGEFRDRTCSACGMIYPKTHIHCRPWAGEIRLCESCGRILLIIEEVEEEPQSSEKRPPKEPKKSPKKASKKKAAKAARKR